MADLSFHIECNVVLYIEPLHTAFATASLIGWLDPCALSVPPVIKGMKAHDFTAPDSSNFAQYVHTPHGIAGQEVVVAQDVEPDLSEFRFDAGFFHDKTVLVDAV